MFNVIDLQPFKIINTIDHLLTSVTGIQPVPTDTTTDGSHTFSGFPKYFITKLYS